MTPQEFQKMLDAPSIKFILNHTMFAQLFYSMDTEEIPDDHPLFQAYGFTPTAYCDGKKLGVNEKFFKSLTIEQQISLLAHETLHAALEHSWRLGIRDPQLGNIAMDYEVNALLKENGFADLPGMLYDKKYDGWPFEKIYDDLLQQVNKSKKSGGSGNGKGNLPMRDVHPCPGTKDEQVEARNRMQSKVVSAARMAEKMQGNIPGAFKRLVENILCPKLPWHEIMRRFMKSLNFNDYDWTRPDRHGFFKTGLVQPRLFSETMDTIVVVIDTSGSIGEKELAEFGFHFNGIRQDANPRKTYLIYCDAAVQGKVEEYDAGQDVPLEARGGGGTDFRPPFEYVAKNGIVPDVLVYFTDTYGTFPEEDPGYPVLWVSATEGVKVPFGELVNFKDK